MNQPTQKRSKLVENLFIGGFFVSLLAVAYCLYYRFALGVYLSESIRSEGIPVAHRQILDSSVSQFASFLVWVLIVTNVVWIVLARYFLSRLKRDGHDT